jgi:hypothetical protein
MSKPYAQLQLYGGSVYSNYLSEGDFSSGDLKSRHEYVRNRFIEARKVVRNAIGGGFPPISIGDEELCSTEREAKELNKLLKERFEGVWEKTELSNCRHTRLSFLRYLIIPCWIEDQEDKLITELKMLGYEPSTPDIEFEREFLDDALKEGESEKFIQELRESVEGAVDEAWREALSFR